jgi:NAD(P)H-nitrite reductase large subunit
MIVCSCFGITDGEIRDAMRADNQSMFAAGTCCGSCLPLVSDIVRELKDDDAAPKDNDRSRATTDRQERR